MMQYSVLWVDKDVRLYSAVPYKSAFRAVVLLEDHDHALAEKDLEIAKLTGERDKYKKEALAKFDCEVCSGSLEDENERLRQQLAKVTAERDLLVKEKDEWAKLAGSFTQGHHAKLVEIEQLKIQLQTAKFNCKVCSGSLQDEHDKLRADYHALLTKAVKFAEEIYKMSTPPERAYRINDVIQDFFSHPHVQAYIKEKYERR